MNSMFRTLIVEARQSSRLSEIAERYDIDPELLFQYCNQEGVLPTQIRGIVLMAEGVLLYGKSFEEGHVLHTRASSKNTPMIEKRIFYSRN